MALFGKRRSKTADRPVDDSPRTLVDETSPYGSRRVLVATNGTETWAQLFDGRGLQVTALWLGTHRPPAPGLQLSVPPEATRSPGGRRPFDKVTAVWFEEGDGVVLYDDEGVLAAVPGWAGPGSLPGYAREATAPTPSAHPLAGPAADQFAARGARAREYWQWRDTPGAWDGYAGNLRRHLTDRLGPSQGSWSLADGRPVVTAYRHGTPGEHVAVTVGMSAQRMPGVEQHVEDPGPHSRIELAVAGLGAGDADVLLLRWLALHPWRAGTWIGAQHTIRWPGEGFPMGAPYAGVLLVDEPTLLPGPPAPDLGGYGARGDRVRYLWLVPITEDEIRTARDEGVEALLARLRASGRSWVAGEAGRPPPADPYADGDDGDDGGDDGRDPGAGPAAEPAGTAAPAYDETPHDETPYEAPDGEASRDDAAHDAAHGVTHDEAGDRPGDVEVSSDDRALEDAREDAEDAEAADGRDEGVSEGTDGASRPTG